MRQGLEALCVRRPCAPSVNGNAAPVPRFYPNAVTLAYDAAALEEQRSSVDILVKSNLPGRWAVKDSFNTLDL